MRRQRSEAELAPLLPKPSSPSDQSAADAPPKASEAKRLSEWLLDESLLAPPRPLIPMLAMVGRVTLLSGREKVGKSTLAAQLVATASLGDAVLGQPVAGPVTTLWYALDEPLADTVRRFRDLDGSPIRLVLNQEPRTLAALRLALVADLAAHPAVQLVVIDTLSKILALSGVDVNDAGKVEPALAGLVDQLRQSKVAAVLLYHTGKGGKEYRGSTAIGATVDEVLTLRKRGESKEEDDFEDDGADDGRRLLIQDGRHLRDRVQLTTVAGRYVLFVAADSVREHLLTTLWEHGGRVKSRSELAKLAKGRRATAMEHIAKLINEGIISEGTRGLSIATAKQTQQFPSPKSNPVAEPVKSTLKFPGSGGYPREGTGPEPPVGTDRAPHDASGSSARNPYPSESGTDLALSLGESKLDAPDVDVEV